MKNIVKKALQKIILNSVLLLLKEIRGLQNLQKKDGYIVASNHASHIDPFVICSIVFKKYGKIVHYVGKKESLNNFIGRFVYNTFDVIPIDRNSRSKKEINKAVKILKMKSIVGIFPEGTRTSDGKMQLGKTGVARLAIYSNKPVVPVAIKNTYELWPKHNKLPKIKKIIRINIGKPLLHSINKKRVSKKFLRIMTNTIMEKIDQLYLDIK